MGEFFIDTEKGELGLEEWKGILDRFPDYAETAVASALKSEGWRLQQIIKYAMLRGGAEGGWAPLSPHYYPLMMAKNRERARAAKIARGVKVRGRSKRPEYVVMEQGGPYGLKPMRKLANAVRYAYDKTIKTVTIGFLDQKKRGMAKKQAEGFKISVTTRMRRMLFAAGFPLAKGTTELTVPPRPIVAPIFAREQKNIVQNIRLKILDNIKRYVSGKFKWSGGDLSA